MLFRVSELKDLSLSLTTHHKECLQSFGVFKASMTNHCYPQMKEIWVSLLTEFWSPQAAFFLWFLAFISSLGLPPLTFGPHLQSPTLHSLVRSCIWYLWFNCNLHVTQAWEMYAQWNKKEVYNNALAMSKSGGFICLGIPRLALSLGRMEKFLYVVWSVRILESLKLVKDHLQLWEDAEWASNYAEHFISLSLIVMISVDSIHYY